MASSSKLRLQVVLSALDKATAPLKKVTQSSSSMGKALKANQTELKQLQQAQGKLKAFEQLRVQAALSNGAIRENQQRLAAVNREIKNSTAPTKALLRERDQLTRQASTLNSRYQQERSRLADLTRQLKNSDAGTGSLANRKQQLAERIGTATQQIEKQRDALAKLAKQQERNQKLSELGGKMKATGQTVALHGAGAAAAGGAGLRSMLGLASTGMEFDSTMSRVQAMSGLDKDSDQMNMLRDQAKQLGASTMFSSTDAAKGQAFLAIAGFTPESIHAAMPGLLDMALAGDMDLGRAADIASNIMGGFKIDPSEMTKVSDVLTKAFTTSNVSLEMLGETMKYVGPVATEAGMDLEEAAAMAGLLGNVGIQGSQAGTTLKAMVLRLASPAAAGRKALEGLGISATDAEGNLRSMPEILSEVAKATEEMGSGDRLEALKRIFGSEPAAGLAELVSQAGSDGLMEYISKVYDNEGAARTTASAMADNLVGDLDQMTSAFSGLKTSIFEEQNDSLRELTQTVTGLIGRVADWAKNNQQLVASIVKWLAITLGILTVLGTLAVTIGTGMMMLGGLIKMYAMVSGSIGIAIKAITLLGKAFFVMGKLMMANPIILAIALLAAAAYLLWRNWDDVIGGLKALWTDLVSSTRGIWEPVLNFFKGIWNTIKTAFAGGIGGVAALIINWSPLGLFYKAFAAVLGWFGIELPGNFTEFGGNLISALVSGVQTVIGAIVQVFTGLWVEIKTAFDGGLLGISQLIINWSPLGLFYKAFAGVMGYFGIDLPGKFTEFGSMLMSGMVTGITAGLSKVKDAITGAGDQAIGWFKDKLGIRSPSRVFAALGDDTMAGLKDGLDRSKNGPLASLSKTTKAMVGTGVLTMGLSAPALAFDSRPPLSSAQTQAAAPTYNIDIIIQSQPGMDESQLAKLVAQELQKATREQAARSRSALYDND